MTKWADYLISAVTYDSERQIISLKRHHDTGDNIGPGELIDKASVASEIDNGLSYMTIFSTLSNWKLGEKIRSFRVDNHYSLRIDDNKVKHDNLGPLPEISEILKDEEQQKIHKKLSKITQSQITPNDKAMLKNMGAQHQDSIASIEAKPETTSVPKLTESKKKSKSQITLSEYEKDYLKRIGADDKISSKPAQPEEIKESPHGTMPKGFDESTSQETKPEPAQPEEIKESPHGTMPKGFDESTSQETKPEPAQPEEIKESPHGTMPKGFDESTSQETKPEPAQPEEIKESPHGTMPKEQEKTSPQKIDQVQSTPDEQSKELNELEKQIGDLKKAVDELDESNKPESSDEKNSTIQAYCVKCKSKRDIKNPVQSELKNGRPAIKGTCSVCETRVCRIGKLK